MKYFVLFFLFGFFTPESFSQYVYKIKADSAKVTNDSCNAELIVENSTRNVPGSFLYNKGAGRTEFRKVLTKLGDSAFVIGGDTVKAGQNAVLNQRVQKQAANYWIDTSKSLRFLLTDTAGKVPLDINGNAGTTINWRDAYPFKGLQSSSGNYNEAGPAVSLTSIADTGSKIRRHAVSWIEKGLVGTIGQTVWGDNVLWPSVPSSNSRAYYVFKNLPGKTLTVSGNKDYPNAATFSGYSIGMQPTGTDTANIQTGWGAGAALNHYLRFDIFPWSPEIVRHKGQYINSYSYLDMSNKAGSSVESFVDYYGGGQNNYNSGQRVKQKINFYAANDQYGYTDRAYGFYQEGTGKLNYLAGKLLIKDSSLLNADVYDFYNGGSSKFAGNIVQSAGRTIIGGAIDDGSTGLQVSGGAVVNGYTSLANTGITGNLGVSGFYDDPINMYGNQNRFIRVYLENLHPGTSAGTGLLFRNDAGALMQIYLGSAANAFVPNGVLFRSTGSGGLNFTADSGPIAFGRSPWMGGAEHARFFYNGNFAVGSTTDDGANKVQVTGTVKAASYVTTQTTMPSSSTDTIGQTGEIRADGNYIYFKTSGGWKRAALTSF